MSQLVKILIVDDEELIRLNLRALLEDAGYAVSEAANGREGLDIFDREQPALVLADLRMPVMDGLAMIAGLQECSPDTPVIVVSGTGSMRDAVEAVRLGAWDYIIKPVADTEEFHIIITRALEKARLIAENRRYRKHLEDLVRERTAALRESEARYRRLLESITSYVYTVTLKDGQPGTTVHGLGCEAVTGFTPAEYVADSYLWYRMVHDNDRPLVVDMTQRILHERLPVTIEHRIIHKDGAVRWVQNTLAPHRTSRGELLSYDGIVVDITERKRAEAEISKLLRAVEQSPAAIVITNTAGNIQYVNPKFTQLTGYTPDEVLGNNPRILKSGETPPEEYQRLWETITHGGVWHGEFHNKQKNGDLYWESASISPVFDAQGAVTHFVAVKEDITARKQTEEALRLLNEELELRVSQRTAELEAVNKELKEFAYIVSHDLKAPLRGINQLTQWLQEDYANGLGAQGQEQLALLRERAKRMDTMIDGILHYSRAVYSSEHEEEVDLNILVSQVIEMLMPPAHITIRLERPLPVIPGDPIQLTQVFQNLLSNAVKFMDKLAGSITVASKDAGDMWSLRVEDNGPGIDPRHHERIFKVFQSGVPRDERDSNGIGLAIVKKIVGFYGGRVWVESMPGHGSRFLFTWPKRSGEQG